MKGEIRIHMETIERIDRILAAQITQHGSRDEFIISAIKKKLDEVNSANKYQ